MAETIPWVEKYRPRSINQLVHQTSVKSMLFTVVAKKNMPHCLFHGPPGTGKTSAALALCRELFNEAIFKRRILELNASDDRGTARKRDAEFTTLSLLTLCGTAWDVIILDEADMMTPDAQSALRRIMEDNARTTRFILLCNYLARIIDPIHSRCAKFRFEPALRELNNISGGDLRMSITLLQTCAALSTVISSDTIRDVAGIPPAHVSESILDKAPQSQDNNFVNDILAESWDVERLFSQILDLLVSHSRLPDKTKAKLVLALAEAQFRLCQGANEAVQLRYVVSCIQQEIRET